MLVLFSDRHCTHHHESHIFSSLNDTCDYLHYLDKGKWLKSVSRGEFGLVEQEMMGREVGDRVERFDLK